jgi:hypothetical protein
MLVRLEEVQGIPQEDLPKTEAAKPKQMEGSHAA